MAVNQIWMHHFNSPLVPSVFDFGRNGKPPTIPELLDWLAVELQVRRLEAEAHSPADCHECELTGWTQQRRARATLTLLVIRRMSITGG